MKAKEMLAADKLPAKGLNQIPNACFAPPLSDELLVKYAAMIDALPPARAEIKDAMAACLACVKVWWELPESTGKGDEYRVHHKGEERTFKIVPLDEPHVEALWETTPWLRECKSMQTLFGGIDNATEKPLRDAAHHLLWFATELSLYREPVTADKL